MRLAWHDNEWNGKVCKDPNGNIYCVDNYSLLSSRIQRRRNVELESEFKETNVCELWKDKNYTPPCYWGINLNGENKCIIIDQHPFIDLNPNLSKDIKPLEVEIAPFSGYTWNFQLSFDIKPGHYKYPKDLEKRVKTYIQKIEPKKSLAFFYVNYGNPISGDDRKYLLVGVALIDSIEYPSYYDISNELIKKMNQKWTGKYFPKIAWQFKISVNPDSLVLLPYHKYLSSNLPEDKKEKLLKDIAVEITDPTLIPNFKYVSMHLNPDKALYVLYTIKQKLKILKDSEESILSEEEIENLEEKINKMLKIIWENRGKYPGFLNLIKVVTKNDLSDESLVDEFYHEVKNRYGTIDYFLDNFDKLNFSELKKFNVIFMHIQNRYDTIKLLSRFDFSKPQFREVIKVLPEFKKNPYVILEKYSNTNYEVNDWQIENNNYGFSLYLIDIPLFPDPAFVNWERPFENIYSTSIERVSALVFKILKEVAYLEGHAYLTQDEILERIRKYPLYYIDKEFEIDVDLLESYEQHPEFESRFVINMQRGEKIYQLKALRDMENYIETFINGMVKKKHRDFDNNIVENLVLKDLEKFKIHILNNEIKKFEQERRSLYASILGEGLSAILGKAGSGKTSAVVNLVKHFLENKKSVFVFTPTGKANLVIRDRLRAEGINTNEPNLKLSTIHRFLYQNPSYRITDYISKILNGGYELFKKYVNELQAQKWIFTPKVVIIDEASMVDEVLLATLLARIDLNNLEHLIIIGDEKQLPPIGVGCPLVDLIYYLKSNNKDSNYVELRTNLRFSKTSSIEALSNLFRSEELLSIEDFGEILESLDETVELVFFESNEDLLSQIREILATLLNRSLETKSVRELFIELFEPDGKFDYKNLDKLQVLSPKRVGKFGSMAINFQIIGEALKYKGAFPEGTKLICEANDYRKLGDAKILTLANGSMGYIIAKNAKEKGYVKFYDLEELGKSLKDNNAINGYYRYLKELKQKLTLPSIGESPEEFSPAYAITVHKSQGSDFDNVILVFSEKSPFITRELVYTGLTRTKSKLYLFVHNSLKEDFLEFLVSVHKNSSIDTIHSLLFEYKIKPTHPYKVILKNDKELYVRSKIEMIITKTLDELNIEFEYEPTDEILRVYGVLPDFKIRHGDKTYYWEHLGMLDDPNYKRRWYRKFEKYKAMGYADVLITTEEKDLKIEENIRKIVSDIQSGRLAGMRTSFSLHHYLL